MKLEEKKAELKEEQKGIEQKYNKALQSFLTDISDPASQSIHSIKGTFEDHADLLNLAKQYNQIMITLCELNEIF